MLSLPMTIFAQLLCFVTLGIGFFLWFSWVQDTMRTIKVPERVGEEIAVYGVEEKNALNLAKVISVGFVGSVAEHKRVVAFINSASANRPTDEISALTHISSPAPSLLKTANTEAPNLDIKLEFAGAKLETQGLQQLLYASGPQKAAVSIPVILNNDAKDDKASFSGVASANFPEDSDYGFSLTVSGSASVIAQQVASRYIQAHYAKGDQFYSALSPDDFRLFWDARTRAAAIAFKRAGGAAQEDKPAILEARDVLMSIEPLVKRYRSRGEMQKLAAYLSTVVGDFVSAKEQLKRAAEVADSAERVRLEALIKKLDQDVSKIIPAVSLAVAGESQEAAIVKQKALEGTGLFASAAKAHAGRQVEVRVVLGPVDAFPQFGDRIARLDPKEGKDDAFIREHTNSVVGLIAALAPTARIRVIPALDGSGAGKTTDILAAINRAVSEKGDILVVALGPLRSDTLFERTFEAAVRTGFLVMAPAGNEAVSAELAGAGARWGHLRRRNRGGQAGELFELRFRRRHLCTGGSVLTCIRSRTFSWRGKEAVSRPL